MVRGCPLVLTHRDDSAGWHYLECRADKMDVLSTGLLLLTTLMRICRRCGRHSRATVDAMNTASVLLRTRLKRESLARSTFKDTLGLMIGGALSVCRRWISSTGATLRSDEARIVIVCVTYLRRRLEFEDHGFLEMLGRSRLVLSNMYWSSEGKERLLSGPLTSSPRL